MSADDSSSYLDRFKTVQPKVQTDDVCSSNKDVGSSDKHVASNKDVGSTNKDVGSSDKHVASNKDVGSTNKDVGSSDKHVASNKDVGSSDKHVASNKDVGSSDKHVASNKDVGSTNKDVGSSDKHVASNKDVGDREEAEDSIIREAVQNSDSKITIWSPLTAAMLQYFRRKTPMFSMSSRGREIIESALEEKYPELSKRIRDEMQKGNNIR